MDSLDGRLLLSFNPGMMSAPVPLPPSGAELVVVTNGTPWNNPGAGGFHASVFPATDPHRPGDLPVGPFGPSASPWGDGGHGPVPGFFQAARASGPDRAADPTFHHPEAATWLAGEMAGGPSMFHASAVSSAEAASQGVAPLARFAPTAATAFLAFLASRPNPETAPVSAAPGTAVVANPEVVAVPTPTAAETAAVLSGAAGPAPVVAAWNAGRPPGVGLASQPAALNLSSPPDRPPSGSDPAPLPAEGGELRTVEKAHQAPAAVDTPFVTPAPLGAGLITEFFPFDRASLDRSLDLFLERFGEETAPFVEGEEPVPYSLIFVTAVVSLEAARRYRGSLGASWATGDREGGSHTRLGLS